MLGLIRRWRQMIAAMINQNDSNVIDVTLRFQVANSQSKVHQDSPPAFPKTNDEERRTKQQGHSMIAKLLAMTRTACRSVVQRVFQLFSSSSPVNLELFSGRSSVVVWSIICHSP